VLVREMGVLSLQRSRVRLGSRTAVPITCAVRPKYPSQPTRFVQHASRKSRAMARTRCAPARCAGAWAEWPVTIREG